MGYELPLLAFRCPNVNMPDTIDWAASQYWTQSTFSGVDVSRCIATRIAKMLESRSSFEQNSSDFLRDVRLRLFIRQLRNITF